MGNLIVLFKSKSKRIFFYAGLIAVILIFGGAIFYSGYKIGATHPKSIIIANVANIGTKEGIDANFGIFWEAWDLLKKEHIKGAETNEQKMVYGAVSGLVDSLGDPNTNFFTPEDSKKFEEDVVGNFGGIGAELGIKNNQLVIIAPLKGNPAEKAGLQAGDEILAIDGKNAQGLDVNEAVKKIRGDVGKEVTLTIFREGWEMTKDFKIIRANIEVPTLEWNLIQGKSESSVAQNAEDEIPIINKDGVEMAHLKLFSFNQNAPVVFYKAALRILFGKPDGIILDLRNNPGGFLEVAVNLAGWFLNKGDVIVTERFKDNTDIIFKSEGNATLKNIPMVILVNKGSASASEILAGALRAKNGVKLIGTQTFGKGTVQELRGLSDGSKIKITIANWVLPDGAIINDTGIAPDYKVEISEEDIKVKKDPQLEKAIEVLQKTISKKDAKNP